MQRIARFDLTNRRPVDGPTELVVWTYDRSVVFATEAGGDVPSGYDQVLRLDVDDLDTLRRALEAAESAVHPAPDGPFTSAARGAIRLHGITEVATEHGDHARSAHGHCTTCGTVWPCRTAVAVVAVNLEAAQR